MIAPDSRPLALARLPIVTVLTVVAAAAGCASAPPLPTTARLEQLNEASVFALAPAAEWQTVAPEDPAQASLDVACGLSPVLANGRLYGAISVKGRQMQGEVAPLNVALVLDRSGSMRGKPFVAMLQAAEAFVSAFRDGDKVSIVVFSDGVFGALEPTVISPHSRAEAVARIRTLANGGGTWLSGGYLGGLGETCGAFAEWHVNQIVLFSDGQPTDGITDSNHLFAIAARAAEHGVGTTTIGFGPDHDELLMQGIADAGGGTYHYVGSPSDIANIFTREANAILRTAVRGAWVEIEIPSSLVVEDVVGWDYIVVGNRVYISVGSIPYGEEHYAVIRYAPQGKLSRGALATNITYADVNRRAKFGLACAPAFTATGGRDTWALELAGHAEAAWGLAEAMGWADADAAVYAISQISYTRDLLKLMRNVLQTKALLTEDELLQGAQTRLGLGVAEQAAGSWLGGGVAGLINFGTQTAAKTATAAVADRTEKTFTPLLRKGMPFTFYGRTGTRYSARGQRAFKLYEPEKSHKYKQARFDAYVMMRVRVP